MKTPPLIKEMERDSIVAVDLGTHYFRVAIFNQKTGKIDIICNEASERQTPCYVAFQEEDCFVGNLALSNVSDNLENVVYCAKLLMGCRYKDALEVKRKFALPFDIIDDKARPKVKVSYKGNEQTLLPIEIYAIILFKAKEMAERHLGHKLTGAVITIPVVRKEVHKEAAILAGRLAGLKVHIINDRDAIMKAYYRKLVPNLKANVMIFSLGAGAFDVSIWSIGSSEGSSYTCLSKKVVWKSLGGLNFDSAIFEYAIAAASKKYSTADKYRFYQSCENAKKGLVSSESAIINYPSDVTAHIQICATITRDGFKKIPNIHKLLETIKNKVKSCITEASCSTIHNVIMVGGSSLTIGMREIVESCFDGIKPDFTNLLEVNEAVVQGAAYHAADIQVAQGETTESFVQNMLSEEEFKVITSKLHKWFSVKKSQESWKQEIDSLLRPLLSVQREISSLGNSHLQLSLLQRCTDIRSWVKMKAKNSAMHEIADKRALLDTLTSEVEKAKAVSSHDTMHHV